ncbi:hypothetical protein Lalb_Chr23g0275211 [Lupinus albus]|uniref:Uncharacterized protein n=1 Tax=Lupinus albus TaxID=3870 RepID=A0A6A4NLN4_LUPAL|nr:hypothetical protein Lalb_Chr23g0275211 [Lupinus albus]
MASLPYNMGTRQNSPIFSFFAASPLDGYCGMARNQPRPRGWVMNHIFYLLKLCLGLLPIVLDDKLNSRFQNYALLLLDLNVP